LGGPFVWVKGGGVTSIVSGNFALLVIVLEGFGYCRVSPPSLKEVECIARIEVVKGPFNVKEDSEGYIVVF
jgi:hypothetical protein